MLRSAYDFVFPRIPFRQLPLIFTLAIFGACIAGIYGVIHDQITYSISNEYFTKFKFHQFSHTNFAHPVRIRVALIGFLATWWVGFFAGWFLARYARKYFSAEQTLGLVLRGFGMIIASALLFGLVGFLFGFYWLDGDHLASWYDWQTALDIIDLRSFVMVGYIHNSGYLGALVGLLLAILYFRKMKNELTRQSQ